MKLKRGVAIGVLVTFNSIALSWAYLMHVEAPLGIVEKVDWRTSCLPRACRLVVTTSKATIRVEPGNFAVGDLAHLERTAWNGTRLCVRDWCGAATVKSVEDSELSKKLGIN